MVRGTGRFRRRVGERIDWHLRRRTCAHFGHKSSFPCVRCGVKGDGFWNDIDASSEFYLVPAVAEYIFAKSPFLEFLRRA